MLTQVVIFSDTGISESVADSYLGQMRGEMSWTRRALQSAAPPPAFWPRWFEKLDSTDKFSRLELIKKIWISEQREWFKKKTKLHHITASRFRMCGIVLAAIGWALTFVLLFCYGPWAKPGSTGRSKNLKSHVDGAQTPAQPSPVATPSIVASTFKDLPANFSLIGVATGHNMLIISSSILVLLGGLLVAYCERRSHEELAKQYERMTKIFTQGEREIGEHLEARELRMGQDVLKALGREAIMENAQWLILRRSRPFELVIQ
jgi:hypothetical protein